jgi:hypothetical protein
MTVSNDRDLIAVVRKEKGLTNEAQFPFETLQSDLDAAKTEVQDTLKQALDEGSDLNIYEDKQAMLEMTRHLVSLHFENRKRGKGRGPTKGKVPTTIGRLRREQMADPNARFHRDRIIAHYNRLVE